MAPKPKHPPGPPMTLGKDKPAVVAETAIKTMTDDRSAKTLARAGHRVLYELQCSKRGVKIERI